MAAGLACSDPAAWASPTAITTEAARRDGWAVVTDHGAVGDGRSRPLRARFADLAAARRTFPSATSLDDETDGAAIQSLIDSGASRLHYPPGQFLHDRAFVVRDGQRHLGSGPATVLRNVRRRDTSYEWVQAHSFQIGNIHPVAMEAARPGVGWAVRRLAPIAAGARRLQVLEPVAPASVRVGDIVMVRSDNPPTVDGEGLTYDFEMWNRVTAWDARTGTLDLELPVPREIVAASGSPSVLAGPTLCLNAGGDYFMRQPWSFAQNVEIGNMALDSAGFSARNGMWRCWFHDLAVTGDQMLTLNALSQSTVERVSGTFSVRMLEVKQASAGNTVRGIHGIFRAAPPGVSPVMPAISIGEQSYDCAFDDVTCVIGPECTADVRALELSSPGLRFRGTLEHRGTGPNTAVWALKSNNAAANPPANVDLDLVVRARSGLTAYGIVGNDTPRPSYPSDVTLRLDQRSDGPPARAGLYVSGGRRIRVLRNVGDAGTAIVAPGAEPPEGMLAVPGPDT